MNPKKLFWMCDIWGIAKAASLWGDQPAPASILGRIQDYGAGAPATRGELRAEFESLTGDALDVNCAVWLALSPDLPRGKRLTGLQYEGLFLAHIPIDGDDGRLMSLREKASRLGIGETTLQRRASLARAKISPFVGRGNRRRAIEDMFSRLCVESARKSGNI